MDQEWLKDGNLPQLSMYMEQIRALDSEDRFFDL